MDMSDLRGLPQDEIESELEKRRVRFFKERFQAKGTTIENPGLIRSLKKDIAQMLTVLRERQLKKDGGKRKRVRRAGKAKKYHGEQCGD